MDIAFKLECLRLADGNVWRAQEMAEWLAGSRPAAAASSGPVCFLGLTAEEKGWLKDLLCEARDMASTSEAYRRAVELAERLSTL